MDNFDHRLLLLYLQDAFIAELLCSILANDAELCKLEIHAQVNGTSPPGNRDPRLRLHELRQRLAAAHTLRSQVYAFNILPPRCRNIYGAYYLYHRFHSGLETNLGEAIQKMDLEETRGQLDQMLLKDGQNLLNRRILMAHQEQADPHMPAASGLVTGFLLAADYLHET